LKHRWRARWEEYDKELDKDIADLLEKQKKDTIKKSDEFKNTHGYIPSTVNSKTNEPSFVMKPDPVKAVSNVTYNLPSYQPNVSVSKPVENSKLNDIESKVESKTKEVVSKTLNNNRGVVKLVKTMNIYEDK
jgi:hypothetical protein